MNIIDALEQEGLKQNLPNLKIGDYVKVNVKVVEGTRERIQAFEGTIIAMNGTAIRKAITVRRLSFGIGVERVFPLHSPRLTASTSSVAARPVAPSSTTCATASARGPASRKTSAYPRTDVPYRSEHPTKWLVHGLSHVVGQPADPLLKQKTMTRGLSRQEAAHFA